MDKSLTTPNAVPVTPSPDAQAQAASCDTLTVLFDGACPLCRREIGLYQSLQSLQPVAWEDVSIAKPERSAEEQARYLARFHVRQSDGTVLDGAAAFVALWLTMPGWRWLGRAGRLPGVTPLLEVVYRVFLHVRPVLQTLVRSADVAHLPADLVADLRSDHAGETGAVWIYHGILCVSRDAKVRDFAKRHGHTESRHLTLMAALLPPLRRSWMLVPWRVAGFLTGALPALFGPKAVFATIAAVETFVDTHYQHQIDALSGRPEHAALRQTLVECQCDEQAHLQESHDHLKSAPGAVLRAWCCMVGRGSAVAVWLARKL